MEFQHSVTIAAPPRAVWEFLWDIQRLAACIPGCSDAQVIEPHVRYSAVVADRIGPIKLKLPLDLVVKSAEDLKRLEVEGNGKDLALGSSVKIDIVATLQPDEAGTALLLDVNADVRGKIAGLGFGLFKRKFDDIMSQFGRNVKASIEASHEPVEQA